jgi:hypothetical protein
MPTLVFPCTCQDSESRWSRPPDQGGISPFVLRHAPGAVSIANANGFDVAQQSRPDVRNRDHLFSCPFTSCAVVLSIGVRRVKASLLRSVALPEVEALVSPVSVPDPGTIGNETVECSIFRVNTSLPCSVAGRLHVCSRICRLFRHVPMHP